MFEFDIPRESLRRDFWSTEWVGSRYGIHGEKAEEELKLTFRLALLSVCNSEERFRSEVLQVLAQRVGDNGGHANLVAELMERVQKSNYPPSVVAHAGAVASAMHKEIRAWSFGAMSP